MWSLNGFSAGLESWTGGVSRATRAGTWWQHWTSLSAGRPAEAIQHHRYLWEDLKWKCMKHFVNSTRVNSFLFFRCVDPGWGWIWHIRVQLLSAVQSGREALVHLQRRCAWRKVQSQGPTGNQVYKTFWTPRDAEEVSVCFHCRFFLVTMTIEAWWRTDWTGWFWLSLSACYPTISRTESFYDSRSWAAVMVGGYCLVCFTSDAPPDTTLFFLSGPPWGMKGWRTHTGKSSSPSSPPYLLFLFSLALQQDGIPVWKRSLCAGRPSGSDLWRGRWLWWWIRWNVLWYVQELHNHTAVLRSNLSCLTSFGFTVSTRKSFCEF